MSGIPIVPKRDISKIKIHKNQMTLGADPEVFLYKPLKNGKRRFVAPPWAFDGSLSKTKRMRVEDAGWIHVDGLAMEYNVDPVPMTEPETFVSRIRKLQAVINEMAEEFGLRAAWDQDWALFNEEYYKALPEELKELGCNPDVMLSREPGQCFFLHSGVTHTPSRHRFSGGHVHYGWTEGADVESTTHMTLGGIIMYSQRNIRFNYPVSRRGRMNNKSRAFSLYEKSLLVCRFKHYGVEWRYPSSLIFEDSVLEQNVSELFFEAPK